MATETEEFNYTRKKFGVFAGDDKVVQELRQTYNIINDATPGTTVDLSGYATIEDLQAAIAGIDTGSETVDLSSYSTIADLQAALASLDTTYVTHNEMDTALANLSLPDRNAASNVFNFTTLDGWFGDDFGNDFYDVETHYQIIDSDAYRIKAKALFDIKDQADYPIEEIFFDCIITFTNINPTTSTWVGFPFHGKFNKLEFYISDQNKLSFKMDLRDIPTGVVKGVAVAVEVEFLSSLKEIEFFATPIARSNWDDTNSWEFNSNYMNEKSIINPYIDTPAST